MAESQTIHLRMAKASREDIAAAGELASILDNIWRGYYPAYDGAEDSPTFFDADKREHLEFLYERIRVLADRGSLFRVVLGLETLLSDANAIVDPDLDHLELHPRFKALEAPEGFARLSLWQDADGFARVQGVVDVAGVQWAVMRRWREDDDPKHPRLRRPFLFAVKSMQRGDDGWRHVPEKADA